MGHSAKCAHSHCIPSQGLLWAEPQLPFFLFCDKLAATTVLPFAATTLLTWCWNVRKMKSFWRWRERSCRYWYFSKHTMQHSIIWICAATYDMQASLGKVDVCLLFSFFLRHFVPSLTVVLAQSLHHIKTQTSGTKAAGWSVSVRHCWVWTLLHESRLN